MDNYNTIRKEGAEQLIDPIVPGQDFFMRVLFPPDRYEIVSQTEWFKTLKERHVIDKGIHEPDYYKEQPPIAFTTPDKPYENFGIDQFQVGKKQPEPATMGSYNQIKKKASFLSYQEIEVLAKGMPEYVEKPIEELEIDEATWPSPSDKFKGVSVGRDKKGYYTFTHRCRGDSYPSPDKIPKSQIDWIESTGSKKKSYNRLKKADMQTIIEKAQKEVGEDIYLSTGEKNWLLDNIPMNVYKQDKSKAKEVIKDDGKMYLTFNSKGEGEVKRIAKEDIIENKIPAQSFVQAGILPIEIAIIVTPEGYSTKPMWKSDRLPRG